VTREDCQNGKPDPEPFLLAARGLGLAAHQCVVIEDTPGGIRAAKAAGMLCVAVTHSCPRDRLWEADLVVDDLAAVDLNAVGKTEVPGLNPLCWIGDPPSPVAVLALLGSYAMVG
jgi:beta-phosphoglucomutase-like phosphatase (HAD superfamily)